MCIKLLPKANTFNYKYTKQVSIKAVAERRWKQTHQEMKSKN